MNKIQYLFALVIVFVTTAMAPANVWAQNKVIKYKASEKLSEVEDEYEAGLHTNAFNVSIVEGGHVFDDENGIGTITFDGDVTSIGQGAFYGCSGLTSITIPSGVTSIGGVAFNGCTGLTSISIPNSVTSIGEWAFQFCTGLTSITIPNSVTSIGQGAFAGCSELSSILVDVSNTNYDSRNNCNAIIEKSSNTLIAGCKNTTIPDNVTSIGQRAFYGCSKLTSVTIPNSVTSIGQGAFSGCSGLTSISIPNAVTSIGDNAFDGCSGLTSISIPNAVTSIGDNAFDGCSFSKENVKTTLDLSKYGATIVDKEQTDGLLIKDNKVVSCRKWATEVTIPDNVTSIGDWAFFGCSKLTSISIPNAVTSIGNWAFSGCSGLTSISIPNSVTSIGNWAFSGCYFTSSKVSSNFDLTQYGVTIVDKAQTDGLLIKDNKVVSCRKWATKVTIPDNVTSIGQGAFSDCSGLTSISIPNSVTSIGGGHSMAAPALMRS